MSFNQITDDKCSNCMFSFELFKHPCNKIHKGAISESTGMFACAAFHFMGDMSHKAIIFEDKDTIACECYQSKVKVFKSTSNNPEFFDNKNLPIK